MSKKMVYYSFLFLLFLVSSVLRCDGKKDISATATCGEAEVFESRLGVINVPQLTLGDYFWVNPEAKNSAYIGRMTYPNSSVVTENPKDKVNIDYDASLDITFDADLPATVKASLKTQVSKSSELTVYDLQRKSLNNAVSLVNADSSAKAAITDHLEHAPQNIIFVVHTVQNADSLTIGLAGGSQTDSNVSIVNFGEFRMEVKYQCSNTLEMAGSDSPVFFKVTPVGYDSENDRLFANTAVELSLADIDLTMTLLAEPQ